MRWRRRRRSDDDDAVQRGQPEFPLAFMVGMEENLFPSARSRDDEARTGGRTASATSASRAMERLSYLMHRGACLYNQIQFNDRSRFIDDIPARLIEDVSDRDGRSGGFPGNKKPERKLAKRRLAAVMWSKSSGLHRCTRPQAGQSNWKPKTSYNVAKPTGQAQSFSGWKRKKRDGWRRDRSGAARKMNEPPKVGLIAGTPNGETIDLRARRPCDAENFGRGAVVRVSGSGSDARIRIRFDDSCGREGRWRWR